MFYLGRNFVSGLICTLKSKQESLANAKVSARQTWYNMTQLTKSPLTWLT